MTLEEYEEATALKKCLRAIDKEIESMKGSIENAKRVNIDGVDCILKMLDYELRQLMRERASIYNEITEL